MAELGIAIAIAPEDQRDHTEIRRLVPQGAAWAVIDWPLPPPEDDAAGTVPKPVAEALVRALLASGHLAFRWDGGEALPEGPHHFFPDPSATMFTRLRQCVLTCDRDRAFGVIVTDDADVAATLFEYVGWDWAAQAVLVYDPAAADIAAVAQALHQGLDWRAWPWLPGVVLLFGAGHDGASAAVAAPDRAGLDRFIAALI